MKIINSCTRLHSQIVELIDKCDDFLFLFSFALDLQYNTDVYKSLINALNCNVKIYILTSGVNEYTNFINHENLVIANNIDIRNKNHGILNYLRKIFNTKIGNDYQFVNHLRFLYNGKQLLFGGTNISSKYNGTHFEIIPECNFTWYESGLLMNLSTKNEIFHDLFTKITDNDLTNATKTVISNNDLKIVFSNKTQYEYVIENINKSTHSIYIENQYIFSCKTYAGNLIFETLASRINKAIYDNADFNLTLIICYFNYDEVQLEGLIMNAVIQQTLIDFRENIRCDNKTFNKYVSIYIPTPDSRIIVHSKVFLFDEDKLLYSTCNIADRSFYEKGDLESSVIIENKKNVTKIRTQLNRDFKTAKHLFNKFDFNDINYFKMWCYKILYYVVNVPFNYITNKSICYYLGLKFL